MFLRSRSRAARAMRAMAATAGMSTLVACQGVLDIQAPADGCGDGTCGEAESCITCEADCGECGGGGGSTGGGSGQMTMGSLPPCGTPCAGQCGAILLAQTFAYAAALDDAYVYWTEGVNDIRRVAKSGGGVEDFALNQDFAVALTARNQTLYWVSVGSDDVRARSSSGGPVTVLAGGLEGPVGVAVDDERTYWVTESSG